MTPEEKLERDRAIWAAHDQGDTPTWIAYGIGCSASTVRRVLAGARPPAAVEPEEPDPEPYDRTGPEYQPFWDMVARVGAGARRRADPPADKRDAPRPAWVERYNERRRVEHRPKACEECGQTFTPRRSDARTCSPRCRQRLSRRTRD